MSLTTVVLADDHRVVRDGLRALLDAEPDISVVGEAADGLEVMALVDRLQPGVLVTDLMMPGLNGLDVTREVRRRSPETRTIILSMYANEAYVLEALTNGAYGYVVKDASAGELVRAVREAAAGRRYLSPPLSESAIEDYARKRRGGGLRPLRDADEPGARGPPPGRRGPHERGDRGPALDQRADGREPSGESDAEARPARTTPSWCATPLPGESFPRTVPANLAAPATTLALGAGQAIPRLLQ